MQPSDTFDFSSMSRAEIQAVLRKAQLALSVDEALTIQNTFLNRPPTFSECVLWSIQGSEHCSYKSSRKHLKQFVTDGPHIILGAKEDAGIVSIATDNTGKRYGIVVSHESHNHPSQIVPYEGAATGVGGNVRDVCCMGAEVIALGDGLRFGDITRAKTNWVHQGVVSGIGGYGNPIGVPTIAGDLYYDPGYNDNCLVTVVTLGVICEEDVIHSYAPKNADNYVYILVGKATDNSGFGGAAFASAELQVEHKERNKGAVQEPNAFLKRHLLKANYALFRMLKEKNYIDKVGFKDLGAGGVACASVEIAESSGYGAEINLDLIPVALSDLLPAVILCSETQERFMWVVPPELVDTILKHYNETFALPKISVGAGATVVGKIRTDGLYIAKYRNKEVVNARASDVTKGLLYDRAYQAPNRSMHEPSLKPPTDYNDILLRLLAHENIASRAPVFETYDKQVQGRTILEAGETDAGVLQPFNEENYPEEIRQVGVTLSLDQNPRYNKIDPYWGAVNAVIESIRNVAAVGAAPVAITDCLCFGNPEKPEQMWEFVESVRGIAEACRAIHIQEFPDATLPIISGNVSLYNESAQGAIPPSPMISCIGKLPDVRLAVSAHLKQVDSYLMMVNARQDECGGSVYYQLLGELGSHLPKPNLTTIDREIATVTAAIQQGLVLSAHDISDGGIAVALAEMSFKNNIGVAINVPGDLATDKKLFSETGGFVLEVAREKLKMLQEIFAQQKIELFVMGTTSSAPRLQMNGVVDLSIPLAKAIWENGLREKLL